MPNFIPEAETGDRKVSKGIDRSQELEACVLQGPDVDEAALVAGDQDLSH